MRCLTLAEHLRKRGAEARFICRAHRGHLIELLRGRNFDVAVLPAPARVTDTADDEDYAAWLGVSAAEDAEQTAEALAVAKPDWLVVDHYSLDAAWERSMRPHASRTLAIDDLANRAHDCDVLLNQKHSISGMKRYAGRVPDGCRLLLGPRYALLRPEFVRHRRFQAAGRHPVRRIFIFLGGTDPGDVTGLALEALSDARFAAIAVDVVVGANNPHRESLLAKVSTRANTRLHEPTEQVAELMADADIAVGAGGGTTWERLCLGVPSVVVSIAANQVPGCEALSRTGLIKYLGADKDLTVTAMRDALGSLLASPAVLAELAERGQAAVDGLGAPRVGEYLDPTPRARLKLRPAAERDAPLYYHWVNDPEVRRQSLHAESIVWEQHRAWFAAKLAAVPSRLFVLEAGELPVGQIRFDVEGNETRIDYSIDPLFRGRGWGSRLLELGLREMDRGPATTIRADVKESNPASSAVFARLGFEESSSRGSGIRVYRLKSSGRRREA